MQDVVSRLSEGLKSLESGAASLAPNVVPPKSDIRLDGPRRRPDRVPIAKLEFRPSTQLEFLVILFSQRVHQQDDASRVRLEGLTRNASRRDGNAPR